MFNIPNSNAEKIWATCASRDRKKKVKSGIASGEYKIQLPVE